MKDYYFGECKWTPSGKFFTGVLKLVADGLVLKIWSLHRTIVGVWELLPIKTLQIDETQCNPHLDSKCLEEHNFHEIEYSLWDDGENNLAVALFSMHATSPTSNDSVIDYLHIRKSQLDKSDSADEIIDLTDLIPLSESDMISPNCVVTLSPDGLTLICSLRNCNLLIFKNPLDSNNVHLYRYRYSSHIISWAPDSILIAIFSLINLTFLELNAEHSSPDPVMGSVKINASETELNVSVFPPGYGHQFLRQSNPNSNKFLYAVGNTLNCIQIDYSSTSFAEASNELSTAAYRPPTVVPLFQIQVSSLLEFEWLFEDPHLPVLFYALKRYQDNYMFWEIYKERLETVAEVELEVELHWSALSHMRLISKPEDTLKKFKLDTTHTKHTALYTKRRHHFEGNPRFPVLGVIKWDGPTFMTDLIDTSDASIFLHFVPPLQTLALRALLSYPTLYEAECLSGRLPQTLHERLSRPINFPSVTALIG